jgi:hypothetical protein
MSAESLQNSDTSVPYQHIRNIYIFASFVAKGLKQLRDCPMVHEFIFKHNNFHCDYLLQKALLDIENYTH